MNVYNGGLCGGLEAGAGRGGRAGGMGADPGEVLGSDDGLSMKFRMSFITFVRSEKVGRSSGLERDGSRAG